MDPLEKYLADTFGTPLADFSIVTATLGDGTRVAVCCPIEWLTSHVDFSMLHPMSVLRGADATKYLASLAAGHNVPVAGTGSRKVPPGTSAKWPAVFVPSLS